jgi:ribonucleoside-diphosphate reductase alpha chain
MLERPRAVQRRADEAIAKEGTLAHIAEMPEDIRRVFVCAHDISPEYHIRMQAAFQRHTDNAVSKTVNFPHSATREEVAEVYMLAYKEGCKGVTIYRDGSRDGRCSTSARSDRQKGAASREARRPEERPGLRHISRARAPPSPWALPSGSASAAATSTSPSTTTKTASARSSPAPARRAAARARARPRRGWSVALRSGIDVDSRSIDQLKGIRCPSTIRQQGMSCTSCPDAIAKRGRKSRQVHQDSDGSKPALPAPEAHPGAPRKKAGSRLSLHAHFCPECGSKLEHEGGCVICRNCGYSKCG